MNIPSEISNFLQQYFDKILVVSVSRFTDRHERVQQHLQGLSFDFFWGVDKLALDISKDNTIYDEEKAKQFDRRSKPFSIGEVACSLSHRKVYEEMIRHNWQRVLIFEDDVLPLYNNLYKLPIAIKELPDDWELVYLGYLKHEKVTLYLKIKQLFYKISSALGFMKWTYKMVSNLLPKPYSAHLKKAGFHDCIHAYAITLDAAKKLASIQTPVVYRADDLLSYTVIQGKLNAFVTQPKLFDQEGFYDAFIDSKIKS